MQPPRSHPEGAPSTTRACHEGRTAPSTVCQGTTMPPPKPVLAPTPLFYCHCAFKDWLDALAHLEANEGDKVAGNAPPNLQLACPARS